jgi:hypothetical protein
LHYIEINDKNLFLTPKVTFKRKLMAAATNLEFLTHILFFSTLMLQVKNSCAQKL